MFNNLDSYIASAKQRLSFNKVSRTVVAFNFGATIDLAGNPGAGVLAGTSTAAGVVPTASTAGMPAINAFGSGNQGYLSKVELASNVASRVVLNDLLFKAGAYSYAAGTSPLSSQPSYSSRLPISGNYSNLEIWCEVVTAFAAGTAWQVQVTYTNQAGTTGRTSVISVAKAAAALVAGHQFPLALQAGDTGVQKIESVIVTNGGTAMTAGTFNILVKNRLWSGRINAANTGITQDLLSTGCAPVFADSALEVVIVPDSTSTGIIELYLEISNG